MTVTESSVSATGWLKPAESRLATRIKFNIVNAFTEACPRAPFVRLDYGRSSDSSPHPAPSHSRSAAMASCRCVQRFTAAGTVPDLHRIPLLHNPDANISVISRIRLKFCLDYGVIEILTAFLEQVKHKGEAFHTHIIRIRDI